MTSRSEATQGSQLMTEQKAREAQGVELKPCPFCGGKAKRGDYPTEAWIENAGASYIECTKCGASTALHFDRKENLISSWNDRASLAQADAPRCVACGEQIKTGDMVIEDITEGPMHAACCGPDRDAYVHPDDGSPLEDGEPIPTGEPYYPDTPETRLAFAAGRASVAQAGEQAPTGFIPVHPDVLRRLGDPELMKRTIGKFSPALAEKMGFTPEEEKALEALYNAFDGFNVPCAPPAPPAPVGVDAVEVTKLIEPHYWADDPEREAFNEWNRADAVQHTRAVLSQLGIPDTSKRDGGNG